MRELTPEQKRIYSGLLKRIDPTYSVEQLLDELKRKGLNEALDDSKKLPRIILGGDRRIARRLTKIVTALSLPRNAKRQAKQSNN